MAIRFFIPLRGNAFWWLFGGIWLIVGVVFLREGIQKVYLEGRFEQDALVVQGMVVKRTLGEGRSSDGRSSGTVYTVTYRFTVDTRTIEDTEVVDADVWESLTDRGPVEVQYLAGDPGMHRLSGNTNWFDAIAMTASGLLGTMGGGAIYAFRAFSGLRRAKLLRHGVHAEATVTEVAESSFRINGVPQWRVRYRYIDSHGRRQEGASPYLPPEAVEGWREGAKAAIRFDPARPDRSLWLGTSEQSASDLRQPTR